MSVDATAGLSSAWSSGRGPVSTAAPREAIRPEPAREARERPPVERRDPPPPPPGQGRIVDRQA